MWDLGDSLGMAVGKDFRSRSDEGLGGLNNNKK